MNVAAGRTAAPPAAVRHGAGVGFILLMALCFSVLDTLAKYLGQFVAVVVVLWARYAVQALVMGGWLGWQQWRHQRRLFATTHPRFQLLRGVLLLICSALLFFGVQHMPVGEFTAIGMLTPVISTLLAALLLHEALTPLRMLLVLGGFVGALAVVRPGSGLFNAYALIPLVMAVVYALFQLLTRKLSGLENPLTTHFYTGLVGTLIASVIVWVSPVDLFAALSGMPWMLLGLLLIGGLLGTAGHLCLILGLAMAPMATLMPFSYAQIALASLGGWIAFRHVPDGWSFVGMGIVAACGAATIWLNLRDASRAVTAFQAPIAKSD